MDFSDPTAPGAVVGTRLARNRSSPPSLMEWSEAPRSPGWPLSPWPGEGFREHGLRPVDARIIEVLVDLVMDKLDGARDLGFRLGYLLQLSRKRREVSEGGFDKVGEVVNLQRIAFCSRQGAAEKQAAPDINSLTEFGRHIIYQVELAQDCMANVGDCICFRMNRRVHEGAPAPSLENAFAVEAKTA